ncbi:right-handed parallel beta-helix repeat-containing protein [Dyella koreensis]|uniref:Right-handed parallel beta-helix repeat-containing protein n=1 Tax=Dyella koreensis TaxID=311235 RepID=A0ABW8JZJ3_9GAMM
MKSSKVRMLAHGLCATLAVWSLAPSAWAGMGHTYYVATTGDDNAAGTLDAPWRTIGRAARSVLAGDTVYVRGGIYKETVDVRQSGSAAAGPIVFASYPGETAALNGSGLVVPAGAMRGLWNLNNVSYVTIQGFDVGYYSTNSSTATPVGIYISGGGSQVQILGNRIHDIVNKLERCPNGNAFGIEVYANDPATSISGLTIDGNEVDHLRLGCSESLSLTGNVEQWTISNNKVHDNDNIGIAALGFESMVTSSGSTFRSQARDGVISGNTVYNISSQGNPAYPAGDFSSDGIYVEGGTRIVIERNLVQQADIGIELACETSGRFTSNVTARNNLVQFSNVTGISIGGASSSNGGTQNATIVNNTLFRNDTQATGSGEFQIQYHASGTVFENNLLYANSNGLLVNFWPGASGNAGYGNPGTIDHNLYFADGGVDNANWIWLGKSYTGVSAYRSASHSDQATVLADPQFQSITTTPPDLHVSATSPAKGTGLLLPSTTVGTLDYAGQPRLSSAGLIDIGAYQQP